MVIAEARALGQRRALVPEWSVPVDPAHGGDGDSGLTLRELIERIVRAEVAAFATRQDARKFVRVLSSREIDAGKARGKIDSGGRDLEQQVDVEEAIGAALQAFEDGLYMVVLDGVEQRELDRQVYVTEQSRVVFLRLVFLAGG